jgi:hypothetical protein
VRAQDDRDLTTVDYFDRLLGLIKNLGRHSPVAANRGHASSVAPLQPSRPGGGKTRGSQPLPATATTCAPHASRRRCHHQPAGRSRRRCLRRPQQPPPPSCFGRRPPRPHALQRASTAPSPDSVRAPPKPETRVAAAAGAAPAGEPSSDGPAMAAARSAEGRRGATPPPSPQVEQPSGDPLRRRRSGRGGPGVGRRRLGFGRPVAPARGTGAALFFFSVGVLSTESKTMFYNTSPQPRRQKKWGLLDLHIDDVKQLCLRKHADTFF